MVVNRRPELGLGVGGPGRRLVLLAGVGPAVGVVEIYHQAHAIGSHSLGHGGHVLLVAIARRRIDPYAQANGIDTLLLEDAKQTVDLAGGVLEGDAAVLHLGKPADVGAVGKGRGCSQG